MNRPLLLLAHDPRMRKLENKVELVKELRGANSEKALPLLLELLCDASWHVRELAADALAERGSEVVPSLCAVSKQALWYTRAAAAKTLGRIADSIALEALARQLLDENPNVRRAVAESLAQVVERKGAGPVNSALSSAGIDLSQLGPEAMLLARALVKTDAKQQRKAA
jgi:HEAT repeat protein